MFKAWVCIIILTGGSNWTPATTIIADIARKSDCERLGRIATGQTSDNVSGSFKCVEIMHTPE